jgi:hypothetical protein
MLFFEIKSPPPLQKATVQRRIKKCETHQKTSHHVKNHQNIVQKRNICMVNKIARQ